MDLIILAVFAVVVLLGLASVMWGADSRPSFVDPRIADTWAS
jgi:hypothetical protein